MGRRDEELKKMVGKTVKSVKDTSNDRRTRFQVHFQDGSIAVFTAVTYGYDIDSEDIEVVVYEV